MNIKTGEVRHLHIPGEPHPQLVLICGTEEEFVRVVRVDTAHMMGVTYRDVLLPEKVSGVVWDMVVSPDLAVATTPNLLGERIITKIDSVLAEELDYAFLLDDLAEVVTRFGLRTGTLVAQPGDYAWRDRQNMARSLGKAFCWDQID